jgi:hypothetical protein
MTDPYAALEAANIGLANVLSYRTYSGSRAPGKVEWDSAQRALDLVRAALDARQEDAPRHKPLTDEQIDAAHKTEKLAIIALMHHDISAGNFTRALRLLARAVERAHGIGDSNG